MSEPATKRQRIGIGLRTRAQCRLQQQQARKTARNEGRRGKRLRIEKEARDMLQKASLLFRLVQIGPLASATASYLDPREQSFLLRMNTAMRDDMQRAVRQIPPSINISINIPRFLWRVKQSGLSVKEYFQRAVQSQYYYVTAINVHFWTHLGDAWRYRDDNRSSNSAFDGLLRLIFSTFTRLEYVFLFGFICQDDDFYQRQQQAITQYDRVDHLSFERAHVPPQCLTLHTMLPWHRLRVLQVTQIGILHSFAESTTTLTRLKLDATLDWVFRYLPLSVIILQADTASFQPLLGEQTLQGRPFTLPNLRFLEVMDFTSLSSVVHGPRDYTSLWRTLPSLEYVKFGNSLVHFFDISDNERFEIASARHVHFRLTEFGHVAYQRMDHHADPATSHKLKRAFPNMTTLTLDCEHLTWKNFEYRDIVYLKWFFHGIFEVLLMQMPQLVLYLSNVDAQLDAILCRHDNRIAGRVIVGQEAPQFQQFLDAYDDLHGATKCVPRVPGRRAPVFAASDETKQASTPMDEPD